MIDEYQHEAVIIDSLYERLNRAESKATCYKTLFWGLVALLLVVWVVKISPG